ncbi:MAG: hypothetical protein QMD82_00310 [bacterium]|nr:hypothetical protein [bacterium]
MVKLILFFQAFTSYPYERIVFSPFAIANERGFLMQEYYNPSVFCGIVIYPAGLKSFSSGLSTKNFGFNIGLLSTGKVESYDYYGQKVGDYSAGILRGSAEVKISSDLVNFSYSLNGIRAYGPDFSESRAWVNIDFYRSLFAFESLSLGLTLSYESAVSLYLFGPYHFVGGDFYSVNDYEVKSAFYWSSKFAGFLFGFSYANLWGENLFKPFFSLKVRHKNLGIYYFYRIEKETNDIVGILICYE